MKLLPSTPLLLALAFLVPRPSATGADAFAMRLLEGARREVRNRVAYDAEEFHIPYPRGDVPPSVGACTDLVVRAFRNAGIDLQEELHEDRLANPALYPSNAPGEGDPNPNLDQRRCRHLVVWFRRRAQELTTSAAAEDLEQWRAGDVVFFNLSENRKALPDHVAIVSDRRRGDGVPFLIDNFPPGAGERFLLISFPVIHSHFRWREEFAGPPIVPRYASPTPAPWRTHIPRAPKAPLCPAASAPAGPASSPEPPDGPPIVRATAAQKRKAGDHW